MLLYSTLDFKYVQVLKLGTYPIVQKGIIIENTKLKYSCFFRVTWLCKKQI